MNCTRCEIRPAKFKCKDCTFQYVLCEDCNEFIHSISISSQHTVEALNSKSMSYEKIIASNDETNSNYGSTKYDYLASFTERTIHDGTPYRSGGNLTKKYQNLISRAQTQMSEIIPESYRREDDKRSDYTEQDSQYCKTAFNQSNRDQHSNSRLNICNSENKIQKNVDDISARQFYERVANNNEFFIENMKTFYMNEIQTLKEKNEFLTQAYNELKKKYDTKISKLERMTTEMDENQRAQIYDIERETSERLIKTSSDYESKINYLNQVIEEFTCKVTFLNKENSSLQSKLKTYKTSAEEQQRHLKHQLELKEIELQELKELLNTKIDHLEKKHAEEKTSLILMNEKVINK